MFYQRLVLMLVMCSVAQAATSVNIDFGPTGAVPPSTYAAAGKAGVWNAVTRIDSTALTGLVDTSGEPTKLTITSSGRLIGVRPGAQSIKGPAGDLLGDYLVSPKNDLVLVFKGLPAGRYCVLTYTVGRQDFPKESTIKLGDDLVTNTGVWSGSLQQGVTHAVHEVIVTPEGFSLAIHSPADAFISAMQIMAIATPLRDGVLTSTTLLVRALHALAGAAWFGAMFYSLTVLHPKAQRYFKTAEEFEEFIAAISHGARWKALGACGLIGATGLALLLSDSGATPGPLSALWLALIIVKTAALLLAVLVFCYTSWRLWPARVLAIPEEVSGFQRRFRIIARVLIALTGLAFVLGILAHAVR